MYGNGGIAGMAPMSISEAMMAPFDADDLEAQPSQDVNNLTPAQTTQSWHNGPAFPCAEQLADSG